MRFKDFNDFWTKIKINEIGKIATGTTPSTKETHFYGDNFLWVTPTDINGKEVLSTTKKLTLAGLNKGRKIPKNSVLATCIASIGKNCILREDGSCNQQINAITPSNDFNVDFVYYLICKNEFQMHANAGHGGMEILNKESFGNLLVNVPNIHEQIKISDFLSLIDKRIDAQNKII